MTAPRVAAVVVSYNTRDDLLRCLASLRDHVTMPMETVVVDNASADGSAEAVRREFPGARLVESAENEGFSRANNRGIRESSAPYILVLNSDAEVRPRAVETLTALLDERPDVGVAGPRTLGSDGTAQVSFGPALTLLAEVRQRRLVRGVREGRPAALRAVEATSLRAHEPAWVSASCFLARRSALDAVGGFDEGFFLYEEDVDLCVRVRRAGWRVVFTPQAEVVHHLGRSMDQTPARARIEYHRSHVRYYRKHNGPIQAGLLRLVIGLSSVARWLRAVGPGGQADRAEAVAALRVALSGR